MKTHLCATTLVVVLLVAAGCATTGVPPLRSEFGDVPVLEGLTYRPDDSIVIETQNVRAVRLLYRGRMEPGSVAVEMQKGLEAAGWRLVRGTTVARHGTMQLFEKRDASLQVQVWEGGLFGYYTYVEVSGTRPAGPVKTTAAIQ
jgi:hypothetical protein